MRRQLITCLLVVVVLTGCYPPPTPFSTFTPTDFKATQSATFTPTSTATPQTISGYRKRCLAVEETMPSGFLSENAFLLLGGEGDNLYALSNQDNGPRLFIAGVDAFSIAVSPDGRWLAYNVEDRSGYDVVALGLEVISADGKEKWTISYGRGIQGLWYWLDNERVVLWVDRGAGVLSVMNVFTGQMTELDYSSFNVYLWESPRYDPTLSRAVFHQTAEVEGLARLVLLDVQSGQGLWSWEVRSSKFGAEGDAVWSPDGSQFVVGLLPDWFDPSGYYIRYLYAVSRDGEMRQLTRYQKPQAEIRLPSWSPDGRYIAFWYGRSLAIFDTTTEVITDYCLSTQGLGDQIYWSPDSRQIATYTDCEAETCLIVVDVQDERAARVAWGFLVGWAAMSP